MYVFLDLAEHEVHVCVVRLSISYQADAVCFQVTRAEVARITEATIIVWMDVDILAAGQEQKRGRKRGEKG
jgi:hypothetical protein